MAEKIGVVGVGRMGANMARRLKDSGYTVSAIYDARAKAAKELAQELGAETCKTLSRVTELADIIITVVSDDAAMDAIFANSGKTLLKAAQGRLFINCATVSPKTHLEVEKRAAKVGRNRSKPVWPPVSPRRARVILYLMCGGTKEAFKRAEPILKHLSNSMRYVGQAGEAAKVKALVNMVMNINTAGLAEGRQPGQRTRTGFEHAARSFFANRCKFAGSPD